ncbi:hypothetical protein [Vallitalea maricola]|uniref:Uncharacterized protein n=1 Tax=Vallitalea maricola TaxID=3074433 RepID=A0ACB5UF82_9FIRM|nr:hypothetical protein AN2V17_08460 [Vallitalea sp. AN17-2]
MYKMNKKINMEKMNTLRKNFNDNSYEENSNLEEVLRISKELDDYISIMQKRLRDDIIDYD